MTEEEFSRMLWPMIHDVSGEDLPDGLDLDVNFREIDIDSLALIEVISEVEDTLGVRLDDRIKTVTTPRGLLQLINAEPVTQA